MATATIPADRIANITMHSCKVTLLAAARQLDGSEEHRADQGHHRRDSHQQSVRLYSRDDVWGALKCQGTLLRALADGWRPLSAQARGAQRPLQEPEFTVPPLASDDLYARKPSDLPRLILIPCYYSNESFEPPETFHVVSKKDGTASASDSGAAESSSCSDPSDLEDSSLPAPSKALSRTPAALQVSSVHCSWLTLCQVPATVRCRLLPCATRASVWCTPTRLALSLALRLLAPPLWKVVQSSSKQSRAHSFVYAKVAPGCGDLSTLLCLFAIEKGLVTGFHYIYIYI